MLRPSKKLALVIEAVVDIALRSSDRLVQSQHVSERMGLPKRYLEDVIQQLVRAGILKGVRGPHGGYRLADDRRNITVGRVVAVVEGLEVEELDVAVSQSPLGANLIGPFWMEMKAELMDILESITIEDLCRRAEAMESKEHKRPERVIEAVA
ncbi:MAG: Rrf2 family transcriptional regulator [Geminicoccaceae bacterium]|nr:Rrf2 family transcriptional regulator [Geminicoccaceae bacterium]MCB9942481.1 Rrf2 family transcriptional regulator [Geminicoccaceae bacterium]